MNVMRFLPLSPPLLLIALCCASARAAERERIDDHWRFHLGDPVDAQLADFDDSLWDTVRLPHDWSINLPRSPDEPSAGGGGFFPTGIGWYRRTLDAVPAADERVWIAFDGVYRNSQVWLNGVQLGRHAYGYTPFEFEITEELAAEGPNTLAVRVDNSAQPNSRWYTGSGIYRHVWLERRPRRSIEPSSCVVTVANLAASSCELSTRAAVTNATATAFDGRLRVEILEATGQVVAATDALVSLGAGDSKAVAQTLHLSNYAAWSPEDPTMYRARWRLEPTDARPDEKPIDAHEISFGVRTVSIDSDRGLLLNGQPIVLYGGNVHHDNGCLGAAAFDDAARRKVRLLLEAGFNAVRTSHNPPSPAFLEACDRLGLLVVDEAFDCWSAAKVKHDFHEHFQEDWRRELTAMVLRDRNHPSVIMWSIGNEMYERGADHAPALAKLMVETVRRLDATRPVTAGVNGLGPNDWNKLDRLFGELDAAGYNYEQARYDTDHNRVPDRVVYSSESYPKDLAFSRDAAMNRSYAIGDFVWSGIDYLGEAGIGQVFPPGAKVTPHWDGSHYPYHGASCGDIDLTGHRKPISHFRNIVWGRGEELSMAVIDPAPGGGRWQLDKWATDPYTASWTWPGREGQDQVIHVCSRWPSVRVELNGNAVAEVATGSAHGYVASFNAPYTPGELTAIALDNRGQERSRFTLATAGPAARVRLAPDRTLLKSNNQGLCFVEVEVVDASGHIRPDAGHQVSYTLTGPGEIVGIGNGDLKSEDPYNISPRSVYHGRALVVLRSNGKPGKVTLTASATELASGRLELTIQ